MTTQTTEDGQLTTITVTNITNRLLKGGFELVWYRLNNWEITAGTEAVGSLKFFNSNFNFYPYFDEDGEKFVDESTIYTILKTALGLPGCTGETLTSTIGEDTICVSVADNGEIICKINGDTRCLFSRSHEYVSRNARILREALRLFKQLAEPGVWCKAGDKDGLKVSRQIFFKKLGFKEIQETGFFIF